jgi:hypothetical protein
MTRPAPPRHDALFELVDALAANICEADRLRNKAGRGEHDAASSYLAAISLYGRAARQALHLGMHAVAGSCLVSIGGCVSATQVLLGSKAPPGGLVP